METRKSAWSMNIPSCLRHVYQKQRAAKIACVLLTVWLCGLMFSYSSQYDHWVSRFQILLTNVSLMVGYLPANMSFSFANSDAALSPDVKGRQININDTQNIKADQKQQTAESNISSSCAFPYIDPFDRVVMALTKYHPPISCKLGIPNLVYLEGATIKVNHSKVAVFDKNNNKTFKECRFKSLDRKPGSDFKTVVINTSVWFNDSITLRNTDDNVVVECYDDKKVVLSRSYFTLIHLRKDLENSLEDNLKKHIQKNAPKEVLSVLFIGIDGNAKQNFQRMMPKTRNFLLNNLKAIELHKYNTVGGKTYTTIVPMLTGHHPGEFENRNWTPNYHFDAVNDLFLWSDFRKAGYRTGLSFDRTRMTAFHYLKIGWNKSPVDYYQRATLLNMEWDWHMRNNGGHCVGDVPEITLIHNLWIQMASTFNNSKSKPYFGFSFTAYLTHDDHNKASAGDDLYMAFLREMSDKNIINNTLIIFFSDHGERLGKIRFKYNGFIESITPYMFLVFPAWFHEKYPNLIKVLKINQERLTTNFDVYETVRDMLNFQATTGYGDLKKRGISLFKEIPPERTCKHADIPITYCVCNPLTPANISSNLSQALASAVLKKLSSLLGDSRAKCHQLTLKSVQNVMVVQPGDPASRTAATGKTFYQLTLMTTPGDAVYETKLTYQHTNKAIQVIGDVTRLNMYRGQADCVNDSRLRPYCFCKT